MLSVSNKVKVISKASLKHYGKFGRVIKILKSRGEPMVRVYFYDTDTRANFYESSLDKIS